jgi:hypothetical protein
MLIIKPYGRSQTTDEQQSPRRRTLVLTADRKTATALPAFAATDSRLVMAQWISAIDQIATKPKGDKKPTQGQHDLRQKLGAAAWTMLIDKQLLTDQAADLAKTWWQKIHPYKTDNLTQDEKVKTKGRWYERFAGDVEPAHVDAAKIAALIYQHLHENELRLGKECKDKSKGRIDARALTIEKNVHAMPDADVLKGLVWTDADVKTYFTPGDVARDIKTAANKSSRDIRKQAGTLLFAHYGRLFVSGGKMIPAKELLDSKHKQYVLFQLHMAIKRLYKEFVFREKKSGHGKFQTRTNNFPSEKTALIDLLNKQLTNRRLAALVRLGKVIHYEAAEAGSLDSPQTVTTNWPDDDALKNSRYWCSEGQTEIKRNEALIRVWRGIIALAQRTLTDWADPDGQQQSDILMSDPIKNVTEAPGAKAPRFNKTAYDSKIALLFGSAANSFLQQSDDDKKNTLSLALNGWAKLRHDSFHFKGRAGFLNALANTQVTPTQQMVALLNYDIAGRAQKMKETLVAAHADFFLSQRQLQQLFSAIEISDVDHSPLPRFRRTLLRAADAWNKGNFKLSLPAPGNRDALEVPARLCQYTALKLIYERAFPTWLDAQPSDQLNAWIDRAVARTTEAAKTINKNSDALARAIVIGKLVPGEKFADFADRLVGRTATEFRVQRNYDSDAEKAQAQAEYINDLKLDVTAQGFQHYLETHELAWLLTFDVTAALPERPESSVDTLTQNAQAQTEKTPWQQLLYFLIHLVPVEEITKLLHQLRKWQVLEKNAAALQPFGAPLTAVEFVLALYLDMHDAKNEGGGEVSANADFQDLFEQKSDFTNLFQTLENRKTDNMIPVRGLREMLRFASLKPLKTIFARHKITHAAVARLAESETAIKKAQASREKLHDDWAKLKDKREFDSRKAYEGELAKVITHRHLAAQVRLTDHVRLHRLLMAVLGRLVDYAGLWERDLYFVTLALVQMRGLVLADCFDEDGFTKLKDGQTIQAVKKLKKNAPYSDLEADLTGFYGKFLFEKYNQNMPLNELQNYVVKSRNDLAHFNMLRPDKKNPTVPVRLNLTDEVNKTRTLMAYDRKLKNAVSLSVKELLAREGIDLTWDMNNHQLVSATVKTRQATHLGDKSGITENLHSAAFVKMVATLFGGTATEVTDVCSHTKTG